jgi:hypothetical protein
MPFIVCVIAADPPIPAAEVAAATHPDNIGAAINISKAKQKYRISAHLIIIRYYG